MMRQLPSQPNPCLIDKTESRRIAVGWSRVGEVYKYKVSMGESVSSEWYAHVLRWKFDSLVRGVSHGRVLSKTDTRHSNGTCFFFRAKPFASRL